MRQAHRQLNILLLLLAALLLAALTPVAASAQDATREIKLNQLRGYEWPTIRVNFNLRSLDNSPLEELKPEQFVVEENGTGQQTTEVALAHDINIPLSIVLVMDTSGSMEGEKLAAAKDAAQAFLQTIGPTDAVAFIPFSTTVGSAVPFSTDRAVTVDALNAQQAKGNTALYDALYAAADLVNTSPPENRRAIVLLTDGQDTTSSKTPLMSLAAAKEAGAQVFSVGVGGDTDEQVLNDLSAPTGGRFIKAAAPGDLQAVYVDLARELAGQFQLTYNSTTRLAKAYDVIRVRITYTAPSGEKLVIETRYRPPASSILPAPVTPSATPTVGTPVALPKGYIRPLPMPTSTTLPAAPVQPSGDPSAALRLLTLAGSLLAAVAVLLFLGGMMAFSRPSPVENRVERYVSARELVETGTRPPTSFTTRVLFPVFNSLGRRLGALTPKSYLDLLQRLLYQMGPPYTMKRIGFLGLQVGLGLLIMTLFVFYTVATAPKMQWLWIVAAGSGLATGFYIPYYLLVQRVARRKKQLQRALPAALDFLAIMVEAGTGFDAALKELVQRWHSSLTDEFALLLIDFQIGKPRRDAWQDLTTRTALPELNSFVVAMLQSEQLGVGVGDILRKQADEMRIRRRQRAEEAARVAPVKMLFPMGMFIFPCILIVILGPAIPQIYDTLTHLGR